MAPRAGSGLLRRRQRSPLPAPRWWDFSLSTRNRTRPSMGIKETAETWVRIDLFCDGLGDDGICLLSADGELEGISDVAPTAEGARKQILNAAVKARWRFGPKLQRWLCPDCVRCREALEQPEDARLTSAIRSKKGSRLRGIVRRFSSFVRRPRCKKEASAGAPRSCDGPSPPEGAAVHSTDLRHSKASLSAGVSDFDGMKIRLRLPTCLVENTASIHLSLLLFRLRLPQPLFLQGFPCSLLAAEPA